MQRFQLSLLFLIIYLAGFGQIATPYFTPTPDTAKTKVIKTAIVKPTAVTKQPQLDRILINPPDKDINIYFTYDEDKTVSKITYDFSTGIKYTDHLFYDEKKRLYLVVNESIDRRTGTILNKEFTAITYTVPASKIMAVSTFNTRNQLLIKKLFTYNGDSVLCNYKNEMTGTTLQNWTVRTAGGKNIIKRKQGYILIENVNFLNVTSPTSFLPEAYSDIYLADKEYIWYVFDGNKELPYKKKQYENNSLQGTSIVYLHEKNIHGWIKRIYRTPEVGGLGTEFRFYYKNE